MEEKKDKLLENNVEKSRKPIPGQVCYDELLTKNLSEKEKEKRPEKITGQIDFASLLASLDERIESSKQAVTKEKTEIDNTEVMEPIHEIIKEPEIKHKEEREVSIQKSKIDHSALKQENLEKEEDEMNKEQLNETLENENDEKISSSSMPPETGLFEKSLDEVLRDSMIPYTECVVLDRALPRVEDGLKPVQRRILFSMLELGVTPDKEYRKSARIVGDCMGKYHPHGDSSVYDAMVRMSQPFSMSSPLVDGHGNFGSVDGDGAAAMRYTEAKLQPLAMELLRDLEKNTVRWSLNFDDTLKEPDILPGRFPNLLVNGSSGIAVGLATNIPTHNLSEVIDGTVALIDNPSITLKEIMKYIPAPDFPTGAYITAGEEVVAAYRTGKGKLIMRSKYHLETKGEKRELVFTEMPYQTNKAAVLQKIVELKNEGKNCLQDISEIRDESDRSGMRAVIRLKKEANAKQVLEYLFKSTSLQTSFPINMVAIADGKPRQMGLLEILTYYVEYQREIILKRTKFDFDTARDRAHILEGILVAIKNIDEVIKIIKKSPTVSEAKQKLREKFLLSDKQAQAILDMRLARLVNLEVEKIEAELKELKERMKQLQEILNSKRIQYKIVKEELLEIKKKYGVPRRSEIIKSLEIGTIKEGYDGDEAKTVVVAVTAENTIKSLPQKHYNLAQKEITDTSTKFDVHPILVESKTDKKVLVFSRQGLCHKLDVSKIPESKWRDKGTALKTIDSNADVSEEICSVINLPNEVHDEIIVFVTKDGFVKRTRLAEYNISKTCFQGIKLKDGDFVRSVEIESADESLMLVSKNGMGLNIIVKDVPIQGRISGGVIAMSLDKGDEIVLSSLVKKGDEIVILTNLGFLKKLSTNEFEPMPRNRKGLRAINFSENGKSIIYGLKYSTNEIICVETTKGLDTVTGRSVLTEQRFGKGVPKVKGKILFVASYSK